MSDASNERTVKILYEHYDQIADFARKSYATDGRGVIQVTFPNVPPGMTAIGTVMMKYCTLQEMRDLVAGLDDGDTTIRMIETYDPSRQAVVMADIEGENPISVKMRLQPPTLVEEPGGVH